MKKIFIILFIIVVLLVASSVFAFETQRTLILPAEGLRQLRIDCGAGRLKVSGADSLDKIEVTADIHARGVSEKKKEEYMEDHVELSLEKRGDSAVLNSQIESHMGFFFSGDAGIDLTVRIPKNLSLEIEDGSGAMIVENIGAACSIEDGSGEIRVEGITGNVDIDDSSGETVVKNVAGDVSIDDGSGAITVTGVRGSVTIDDGSGSITVRDIDKDVVIEEAGSGGVSIDNIKGRIIRHDIDEDDDDEDDDEEDED